MRISGIGFNTKYRNNTSFFGKPNALVLTSKLLRVYLNKGFPLNEIAQKHKVPVEAVLEQVKFLNQKHQISPAKFEEIRSGYEKNLLKTIAADNGISLEVLGKYFV